MKQSASIPNNQTEVSAVMFSLGVLNHGFELQVSESKAFAVVTEP